jgi:HAD superfamily hydrolase (TIGR01490 family)
MIAALFDADGTLYSAQYGRGLMEYARTHGYVFRAWVYYASLATVFLLARLKLADGEAVDRAKIAGLARMLRGWDESQSGPAFAWVTDEYLLATRRDHVIRRLRAHQAEGHLVVIASGTFLPSLRLLGERLGVTDLVGTQIEIRHGRFTGRILPPIIKGADKAAGISKYVSDHKMDIDWAASYAYGDSYSDRAFMALAGHPVAVQPDSALRALAQHEDWEILER